MEHGTATSGAQQLVPEPAEPVPLLPTSQQQEVPEPEPLNQQQAQGEERPQQQRGVSALGSDALHQAPTQGPSQQPLAPISQPQQPLQMPLAAELSAVDLSSGAVTPEVVAALRAALAAAIAAADAFAAARPDVEASARMSRRVRADASFLERCVSATAGLELLPPQPPQQQGAGTVQGGDAAAVAGPSAVHSAEQAAVQPAAAAQPADVGTRAGAAETQHRGSGRAVAQAEGHGPGKNKGGKVDKEARPVRGPVLTLARAQGVLNNLRGFQGELAAATVGFALQQPCAYVCIDLSVHGLDPLFELWPTPHALND